MPINLIFLIYFYIRISKNISKHYRTNKKEYYINLSTADARIIQPGAGNNRLVFEWNVNLKQNLSRNAKIGIISLSSSHPTSSTAFNIRCAQVKNDHYESGGNLGAIIYMDNGFKQPLFEKLYPLAVENLDTITITITESIGNKYAGVSNTVTLVFQLKVIDYDTEEVHTELMPTYTKDSTAIHYKI